MPALGRDAGTLEPGGACTDHGNVLWLLCLRKHSPRSWQRRILDAANGFSGVSTGNADIGAGADAHVAFYLSLDLGKNLRVTDMGAGHTHHVGLTSRKDIFRMGGVHDPANREHGNIYHLADRCREVHEDAMGCGCRGPVACSAKMRDIGMGDDVEVVHQSASTHQAADLLHLSKVESARFKFIARQANAQNKIRSQCAFYRFQQFHQKAHTVFKRAAVMIGTSVGQGRQKGLGQESKCTKNLNTVHTARRDPLGSADMGINHLLNLAEGHFMRDVTGRLRTNRRCRPAFPPGLTDQDGPTAVRQLGKNAATFLVYRIGEGAITRNDVIVKVPETVFVDAQQPRFMYRGTARNLKANPVSGIVTMICDVLLAGLVVLGKAGNMG